MRIIYSQLPDFNSLTELQYIYYSVGLIFYQEQKQKLKSNFIQKVVEYSNGLYEQLAYQIADIKSLMFDISCCTRGLCGVKQAFNYKDLPSQRKNNIIEHKRDQTEEQRLQRHKRFFEQMKAAYGPKKMTQDQKARLQAGIALVSKYSEEDDQLDQLDLEY